jgi:hypothetical protein
MTPVSDVKYANNVNLRIVYAVKKVPVPAAPRAARKKRKDEKW